MCAARPSGALVVLVAVQGIRTGIVSPAGVQEADAVTTAPDNHFSAGPDCRVTNRRADGRIGDAGRRPGIGCRIVFPAGVQIASGVIITAPNDHFTAGPDCRVICSFVGRVDGACGSPSVKARAFRLQCGHYRWKSIT